MRIQYQITPAQVQETSLSLTYKYDPTPVHLPVLSYAHIKIFSDTKPYEFIEGHNVSLPQYLTQLSEFLHSNQARGFISGVSWGEYSYEDELYMPTGTSFLSIGPKPGIKIKPPTDEQIGQVLKIFLQGYIQHLPQLAAYSGLKPIQDKFGFKLKSIPN